MMSSINGKPVSENWGTQTGTTTTFEWAKNQEIWH